jgi:hypothetical protein
MPKSQPSDTDLIKEMVASFGKNQQTLHELVGEVEKQSRTNLDPIAQSKLKLLRRSILVEDVKGQDYKIKMISDVLKEICSPVILPGG